MKLTKILENTINRKLDLMEAPKSKKDKNMSKYDKIFSDEYLTNLGYGSYKTAIKKVYDSYKKSNNINYDVLDTFAMNINSFEDLQSFIDQYAKDQLVTGLYWTAQKEGS